MLHMEDLPAVRNTCAFLNWAPRHEGVVGEWMYNPMHYMTSALDGGEWSASRSRPLYLQRKSPWYPLDRRLCGPPSRSGRGGEEKNSHPLPSRSTDWTITDFRKEEMKTWGTNYKHLPF